MTICVIDEVRYPKKPSVNPERVNCGHMTSPKVTIHFGLITFDRSVIQASLVNTDRMIYNVTYLGQIMTFDLRSNFIFEFSGLYYASFNAS